MWQSFSDLVLNFFFRRCTKDLWKFPRVRNILNHRHFSNEKSVCLIKQDVELSSPYNFIANILYKFFPAYSYIFTYDFQTYYTMHFPTLKIIFKKIKFAICNHPLNLSFSHLDPRTLLRYFPTVCSLITVHNSVDSFRTHLPSACSWPSEDTTAGKVGDKATLMLYWLETIPSCDLRTQKIDRFMMHAFIYFADLSVRV